MLIKKIVFVVFVVFCIFIINDLVYSIYNLWQKSELLENAKKDLRYVSLENKKLKERLKVVAGKDFVETQARNKLFMARPGEEAVVVDPERYKGTVGGVKKKKDLRQNWVRWKELFF